MHTISHTIIKLSVLLLAAFLSFGVGGCRKEGFTRLMDVEMKYQVLPDAERVRLGDTVRLIAWLPYKNYDRFTNSTVDIRGMEIKSWGNMGYMGTDYVLTNYNRDPKIYKFETFFEVQHPFGTFQNYPQNHIIGTMHANDTAFYFELRLVARRPGVFKLRGEGGDVAFWTRGSFRLI